MGAFINLTAGDGAEISAWRADPADKPRGGVVVIQEIFGVNHHIRAVADFFASQGYLAIAPALFDRVEKGVDLKYDGADRQTAMALMGKLDNQKMMLDVAAAVRAAKEGGKVAAVGYCLGGSLAYFAASRLADVAAAVGVKEFAAAHPDLPVYIYPADHGFNCDERASYDAPSAALARTRTLDFLAKAIG
jgi:carboxymethylenebutenolidase